MRLTNFMAPCPYCYTNIDLRKVTFRCLGRPVAGKKACSKKVDDARSTYFGDLNEYYPTFTPSNRSMFHEIRRSTCPDCLGTTGVRLCPQCHSRLPDGFSSDSPLFGLVGARSAGKTVMLAVLMRELATNGPVARRFRHVITLYGANEKTVRLRNYKTSLTRWNLQLDSCRHRLSKPLEKKAPRWCSNGRCPVTESPRAR